jgi:hypothetical protein
MILEMLDSLSNDDLKTMLLKLARFQHWDRERIRQNDGDSLEAVQEHVQEILTG